MSEESLTLSTLPDAARAEVDVWRKRLATVWRVKQEGGNIVAEMERAARQHSIPFPTLRAKWYAYIKQGPLGLINRAKYREKGVQSLPHLFMEFWKQLLENHQRDRSGREAHRKLMRQLVAWRGGDDTAAIPGYDSPPPNDIYTAHPRGWSLANLRRHGLSKYLKALRRQGTMAAKNFLPSVRSTRVGLDHMEMVMVDDQWHDVHINFVNERGEVINRRLMRPLSFNALDVSSGCDFAAGYKPIIWDEFTQQRKMLTEKDFFWFVIHILSETGWRADGGTTIVHEHGTANLSQALRDRIIAATDGGVRFSSGGILGEPMRKGMLFAGQPRGNFKFKSHRESWFNLFRNYCCALPANTGLNPKMSPEENYGLTKYNNMLLRAMDNMPPQRSALLMLPALNWHQFVPLANQIRELINRRIDHNLEGWEELGRIAQEVRLHQQDDRWLSLADIAKMENPQAQALALSLMDQPGYSRSRQLSPHEAFDQGRNSTGLTKLSPRLWNVIMPAEFAHTVKVNDKHEIIIRDREVSPSPLVYIAHVRTARGREEIIPAGETVRVYCNPYRPETILVCEPDDSAIGLATLMPTPSRMDTDGMLRVNGGVKALESHLQRESAARAAGIMEQRAAMRGHNQRVLGGQPVTADEIAASDAAADILASDDAPFSAATEIETQEVKCDPLAD